MLYNKRMSETFPKSRDHLLYMSEEAAAFYPRNFYPFDNFSAFQVEWRGRLWPTVEHVYQASKFFDTAPEVAEAVFSAISPHDAYKFGQVHKHRRPADWEKVKVGVMEEIVRAKVSQHYYVQKKLLETGNRAIIEDSPKDSFWGWGPNRDLENGNALGKIWMKLRTELQLGQIALLPEPSYEV